MIFTIETVYLGTLNHPMSASECLRAPALCQVVPDPSRKIDCLSTWINLAWAAIQEMKGAPKKMARRVHGCINTGLQDHTGLNSQCIP